MQKYLFKYESFLPFSQEDVFAWHMREGALDRMIPPWVNTQINKRGRPDVVGSKTVFHFSLGPYHTDWVSEHTSFTPNKEFVDEQRKGPFRYFRHTHKVEDVEGGCILKDTVEYATPFFLSKIQVEKHLERQFSFRHKRLLTDLSVFSRYDKTPKKILVSGSHGMVGAALCSFLSSIGADVWKLHRGLSDPAGKVIGWDPIHDGKSGEEFEGFDAVIHLAGENIGKNRWSLRQKERIFQSRCRDTWLLAQILSRLNKPPQVFISASAVGIYADLPGSALTESSPYGTDFLADLCKHWEKASDILAQIGVRICSTRFGYILSPKGGLLRQLLPAFRLGLGGRLGSGEQMFPWVALDDVVYGIYHCIMNKKVGAAVNITAPSPVSQEFFAKTVAKVLHSPNFASVPEWLLRLLLGERADALILKSIQAVPERLLQTGYRFCYTDLESFLKESL